jgi:hypothetical protein
LPDLRLSDHAAARRTDSPKPEEEGAFLRSGIDGQGPGENVAPPDLKPRPCDGGAMDNRAAPPAGAGPSAKTFTAKQGQYLAYIHLYTRLHRRPPAETDMQQYFRVTPPSVHQMVLTLERAGFIRRQPRAARSIEVLVDPQLLPELL